MMPSSPLLCLCDICVGQEDFVSQCTSCPACRYCLSACQSQLLDVDLRSRNKSNLSSRQCNCIKHNLLCFFFCAVPCQYGMSPLMHATYKGKADMCKLLLQHGADVNCNQHEHGYTALMFAGLSGIEIKTFISRAYHSVGDILRWSNLRPDSVFLQVKLTSRG